MLEAGRLRDLRRAKNLTLEDLARATGLSTSYISQVERQLVNPSLSALEKIAETLDVSMLSLFDAPEQSDRSPARRFAVIDPDRRLKLIYPGSNVENQLLTPALSTAFEFFWTTVPPGGGSRDESYGHRGVECGVVIQGTMEFYLGEETFVLGPGQSIYFDPTVPHYWRNIGQDDVHAVWVVSPAGAEFPA